MELNLMRWRKCRRRVAVTGNIVGGWDSEVAESASVLTRKSR